MAFATPVLHIAKKQNYITIITYLKPAPVADKKNCWAQQKVKEKAMVYFCKRNKCSVYSLFKPAPAHNFKPAYRQACSLKYWNYNAEACYPVMYPALLVVFLAKEGSHSCPAHNTLFWILNLHYPLVPGTQYTFWILNFKFWIFNPLVPYTQYTFWILSRLLSGLILNFEF